jgi:hypothetical protein
LQFTSLRCHWRQDPARPDARSSVPVSAVSAMEPPGVPTALRPERQQVPGHVDHRVGRTPGRPLQGIGRVPAWVRRTVPETGRCGRRNRYRRP